MGPALPLEEHQAGTPSEGPARTEAKARRTRTQCYWSGSTRALCSAPSRPPLRPDDASTRNFFSRGQFGFFLFVYPRAERLRSKRLRE